MERWRAIIGVGFLYMFALLGLYAVTNHASFDSRRLVLHTIPSASGMMQPGEYYPILQYEIGIVDLRRADWDGTRFDPGEPAFVTFEKRRDRAVPTGIYHEAPEAQVAFLRGVVRGRLDDALVVHYGAESFLIPEESREDFDGFPRPFDVLAEVGDDGVVRVTGLTAGDRTLVLFD